jgi:cell division protease FtsH
MSNLGMIRFSEESDYVFLGRDMSRNREYSESTAQQIDAEVKSIIDGAYAEATDILEAHKDKVALIANALLEFETLDGAQVKDLIDLGYMRKMPVMAPKPPPLPPPPLALDPRRFRPNSRRGYSRPLKSSVRSDL